MATLKQKIAFKKIAENHGNISKSMLQVGYSPNTARKPQNLTRSKGWEELMEKYLPDSELAKKHKELLEKREINLIRKKADTGEEIYEVLDQPETQAVSKALDMAYKLKSRYPEGQGEGNKTLIINITEATAKRYGISPASDARDSRIRPA